MVLAKVNNKGCPLGQPFSILLYNMYSPFAPRLCHSLTLGIAKTQMNPRKIILLNASAPLQLTAQICTEGILGSTYKTTTYAQRPRGIHHIRGHRCAIVNPIEPSLGGKERNDGRSAVEAALDAVVVGNATLSLRHETYAVGVGWPEKYSIKTAKTLVHLPILTH